MRGKNYFEKYAVPLVGILAIILIFNSVQVSSLTKELNGGSLSFDFFGGKSSYDVSHVSEKDLSEVQNTAQSINLLIDLKKVKDTQSAIDVVIPKGTPDYGSALGVSYDDPVTSLGILANQVYPSMINNLPKDDPEVYQRYVNLATKPLGISCEYCCGVGPIGARPDGKSACGCQHNPALLGLTMWLMENTEYSDAEVVREVLAWKALFFPKNMVQLTLDVAGGDSSALNELPGMVGGC